MTKKLGKELEGIKKKTLGPQGVQYSLRAQNSGTYPCYNCSTGTTFLHAGDVWKYGETTNPGSRYTQRFIKGNTLRQVNEFSGNQMQIKVVEKLKIYQYFFINGKLPPGNRIFR